MKKTNFLFLISAALMLLTGCAERKDATLPYGGNVLVYLGRTPVRGAAKDAAVVNNLAYVADQDFGISIYDLSDPANPQLVDSLATFDPNLQLIAVDSTGRIAAVQAATAHNVQVYDLLMKQFLFSVGSDNHYKIEVNFAQDTLTIYRADKDQGDGFNVEKYVNSGSGDTLSFGFPVFFSNYGNSAYGFALANDNKAYVCRDILGFVLLDYTSSGAATVLVEMNTPGKPRDAGLSGNTLCLAAGYEGLLTLDVSDPINPVMLGSLIIQNSKDVERIEVVGNRAYLQDAFDGILAADISNPSSPMLIGTLPLGDPNNFCVAGDLVLVADEDMGLVVGQILY